MIKVLQINYSIMT